LNASNPKSIRQTFGRLPDFRNLGVVTRVLLAANLAGLLAALLRSGELREAIEQFAQIATALEPSLLATLLALHLLDRQLRRLGYVAGLAIILCLAAAMAFGVAYGLREIGLGHADPVWSAGYAILLGITLAAYFSLRERAFSPALSEARLQALQARIRPHFLFNSITAVLSLMRRDPRRAETALEDMAELFRSVMSDNRDLVTLEEEVTLTRRYLDLEMLRLGERLIVEWKVDPACASALVPPMLLQPLVENAVYHGIEPGVEPGRIDIGITRVGGDVHIELFNPYWPEHQHRQGNRMALANIAERLNLHFDVEATLETDIVDHRYRIRICLPLRAAGAGRV
jgi:two-component system sensor histidine kinase AlgZ